MKYLFVFLLMFVFLPCRVVLAQQRLDKKLDDEVKVQSDTIASLVNKETKEIKQQVKEEPADLKEAIKEDAKRIKPDKEDAKNVKKLSGEILEEKATTNLNYDSDNPENAPWKKQQFSKDDLKKFDSPLKGESAIGNKSEDYKNTLNPAENDKVKMPNSAKSAKHQAKADSIIKVKESLESKNMEGELLNTQQIYSRKYIQKVYDSLGISKADSLFQLGSALAKTETPKEELLSRINTPLKDQAGKQGVGYDDKSQSLKSGDGDKLQGINDQYSKTDLSKMQLPSDVLSELAPLKGRLLDSKYIKAVDSMRQEWMKAKGYRLDEKQVTEEVKKTSFNKKPSFLDKSYFEMVVGFVNDSSFTVIQVSPSWAYHFTDHISAGVGPNISIDYKDRKINGIIGFRTFAKAEVWKQRAYFQIEDNFDPIKRVGEKVHRNTHNYLAGGGGLIPISKRFAINIALFYRLNQNEVGPGGNPWVARIGLSSIKKLND